MKMFEWNLIQICQSIDIFKSSMWNHAHYEEIERRIGFDFLRHKSLYLEDRVRWFSLGQFYMERFGYLCNDNYTKTM